MRAIAFCAITIPAVYFLAWLFLDSNVAAIAGAGAYAAWILTRPRMIRVIRRLRGEQVVEGWGVYYRD